MPNSVGALFLGASLLFLNSARAQQVTFADRPVGEPVKDQFQSQGLRFVPFQDKVTGVIFATPTGNVARFDVCSSGGTLGCEFFESGARGEFSASQSLVTVRAGLIQAFAPVQALLVLTAFDAGGQIVDTASQLSTTGAGLATVLTVRSPAANITSFTLAAGNDPAHVALIAIADMTYSSGGLPQTPDFSLDAPPFVGLIAGGAPVDVTVVVKRINGSTGPILFAPVENLPPGVTAAFLQNPAPGTSAVLRFAAPAGTPTATGIALVRAAATLPSGGSASRTSQITIGVTPGFAFYGPADIDLSTCNTPGAALGILKIPLTAIRDYRVAVPVRLSIMNLPSEVKASLAPPQLDFLHGALQADTLLTLTVPAGVSIPDSVVALEADNGTLHSTVSVLLHGTCSRQSKNFVIRGAFEFNHIGILRPVEGARVEIFRERGDWFNDYVGKTATDAQGHFEMQLAASRDGTYYAKLVLNDDQGVYLKDAGATGIWQADSVQKGSNKDPVIDLGVTLLSKDGGKGTPKVAVWQGARSAYREFIESVGRFPPNPEAYQISVYYVTGFTPTSHLATTTWPINWPTAYSQQIDTAGLGPVALRAAIFSNYRNNFHEFGHTIRQSVDGDYTHFTNDSSLWTYGRGHNGCRSDAGDVDIPQYAFNEAWAEYWAGESCGSLPVTDYARTDIEGAVGRDLNRIAASAFVVPAPCEVLFGGPTTPIPARPAFIRKSMFSVLERGQNIIHTAGEFRREFQLQFPTCVPPPYGMRLQPTTPDELAALPGRWPVWTAFTTTAFAQEIPKIPSVDRGAQLAGLRAAIESRTLTGVALRKDLEAAVTDAATARGCPPGSCAAVARRVLRPALLQGAIAMSGLQIKYLTGELNAALKGERGPEYFVSRQFEFDRVVNDAAIRREAKQIVLDTLNEGQRALTPLVDGDRTGELRESLANIRRQLLIQRLETPSISTTLSPIELPWPADEDQRQTISAATLNARFKWIWLVLLAAGLLLTTKLVRSWLRRRETGDRRS